MTFWSYTKSLLSVAFTLLVLSFVFPLFFFMIPIPLALILWYPGVKWVYDNRAKIEKFIDDKQTQRMKTTLKKDIERMKKK